MAARRPRFGVDTDHRTIPNELAWLRTAVHLDKGCYRGQETVARVHNLGRPPRRLVLLHLDGVSEVLAEPGTPVLAGTREVGRVGTVVRHYELGVIALALVKQLRRERTPCLTVAGSTAVDRPGRCLVDGHRRHPGGGPRAACARSGLRRSAGDPQHADHRRAHRGRVREGRRPGAAGDRRGGRGDRAGLRGGRAPR